MMALDFSSLRVRVALAFAWFGALVNLSLAIGIFFSAHDVGRRLMDETLVAELDDYAARRGRNPSSLPPATVSLRGFVHDAERPETGIPEPIRALPVGSTGQTFHDTEYQGNAYRVLVSRRGESVYYMLFNKERQTAREERFIGHLSFAVLLMTLLAAAGGWWLAGGVTAPVIDLARKVASSDPDDPLPALNPQRRGDEVFRLAQAFERYIGRLRSFGDRERAFTSDASHEFRTPLAVIRGAVELLQDDPGLSPRQKQRLDRIDRAAREMTDISTALLHLAREENARSSEQSMCPMDEVVRSCLENYAHLIGNRPVRVRADYRAAPLLPVERALASVVVGNLIRNAMTHIVEGEIEVVLAGEYLEVADTGPGISREAQPHLFKRYYHGSASPGHGIGLSLVKRICDLYRWGITIDSIPGQGTRVHLAFSPAAEGDPPTPGG
ncbi:MAG: HAMP domain-containing histidine kinase [Magnetococcales bacterium]|nr:HAMP domain-containing histidine kinase [Magnetococcales bacterium]